MSLEQQISKGIMEAMKAKDTVRLGALRNAKKYIIEAKTAGPEIAELPDADVLKIISKLDRPGRRHVGDADGQGDGRGHEEARRTCRRQGYFGQGQGTAFIRPVCR